MVNESQTLATIQQREALRQVLAQPTPGQIVNIGLQLYRQDPKFYVQLAAEAHVWLLVPIYGWAKFFAIAAMMSRIAYFRLLGQPEPLTKSRAAIAGGKLWRFWWCSLLVGLIFVVGYLVLSIALSITALAVGFGTAAIALPLLGDTVGGIVTAGAVLLVIALLGVTALAWLSARLFMPDAVLAIEGHSAADRGIGRSWRLTKQAILPVILVVSVAFMVALPILSFTNYFPSLGLSFLPPNSSLYWVFYLLSLGFSILGNILVLPLWQCVKAVMYCDLRMRQEGLDLILRDRDVPPPPQDSQDRNAMDGEATGGSG